MRSGILGGTRACLCKNGTYDVKCCDGGLWAQGIGNITKEIIPESAGKYKITHCDTGQHHNIHIHDTTLVLNNVYFFYFENTHHNGCYTVTEVRNSEGLHVNTVELYVDCATCLTAHP